MKLLFFSTMAAAPWGGSEEILAEMANDSLKLGHQVFLSVFDWGKLPVKIEHLRKAGCKVFKRPRFQYPNLIGKVKGKIVQKIFSPFQLRGIVRAANPDLVIINMGGFCDLEVSTNQKFLESLSVPYLLIVHVNPDYKYVPAYKIGCVRRICEKANRIYFVSKRLREIAERQIAWNFPNSEIIVNPVNMDSAGILPPPDKPDVQMGCVGRLSASIKGQALLIQILGQEKWKRRNWQLNIYGTGPDKDYLIELAKFYQIEKRCAFHGHVTDVRNEIWKENHVLVLPSYYEGMPLALVEAMLCGRTAVVTDVGGNSELITDEENGFIAEAATTYSLDKALDRMWNRRHELHLFGEKAYRTAISYRNRSKKGIREIIENIK